MADNITYSSGVPDGTIQRTDETAGGQVPYVKLMDATSASETLILAGGGVEANALRVTLASDSTGVLSVDDNGGSLTVDGTVAATQSGTWNVGTVTTVTAVTSITNTVTVTGAGGSFPVTDSGGSLTVDAPVGTPVFVRLSDGVSAVDTLPVSQSGTWNITNVSGTVSLPTGAATAAKQPALGTAGTASADVITVQGIASMTALKVDGSGVTQPVSGTVTANLSATDNAVLDTIDTSTAAAAVSLAILDDWDNGASDGASVSGDVAHDTADAGEPVKIGAKATTGLSGATMVADADRVNAVADVDGAIIYRPYCPLPDVVRGNSAGITDGSSTEVIAAQSAGVRTYITTAILTNTSATNLYVELKDGATSMAIVPVPATGGAVVQFPVPLRGTAATAWNADPSAAASTVYCTLVGFKSKV